MIGSESELIDRIVSMCRKWTIGIGQNGEISIYFSHHPNHGEIVLYDSTIEDLRNLGEMFISVARKMKIEQEEDEKDSA
jgi:hypothetical protein